MASEAETTQTHLSLLRRFFLGIANIDPSHTRPDPDENSPDPDQNSANGPDPRSQTERIILITPLVIGQALLQEDHELQGLPPASKAAVESMAVVEIQENEVGECAICLEDWKIGGGIVKEMPCVNCHGR